MGRVLGDVQKDVLPRPVQLLHDAPLQLGLRKWSRMVELVFFEPEGVLGQERLVSARDHAANNGENKNCLQKGA